MAIIDPIVMEGARFLARQAISSSLLTASSSAPTVGSTSFSGSPTNGPTNGAGTTPTSTSPPSATTSPADTGGGGNSSPLLFFVALGFGVVFTNLWIIVGVKYCFRYNARSRQLRLNEDGEPINMDTIQRPHRRRREKKLMTMDEVNEKFPMVKYKTWVASRAQEGLPTSGGVTAPASRANSVRDVEGVVPELPSKERESTDDRPATSATSTANPTSQPGHETKDSTSSTIAGQPPAPSEPHVPTTVHEDTALTKADSNHSHDDDEDEDEHIDAALPPECVGTSGDTCAICIDALEDDDDVRGLTCGHAFHAVCLDPWLTSRRACCPLCKADYYTPKPRPAPADGSEGTTTVVVSLSDTRTRRGRRGINMPAPPPPSRINLRATTRRMIPSQRANRTERSPSPARRGPIGFGTLFRQRNEEPARTPSTTPDETSQRPGMLSNLRTGLRGMMPTRRNNSQEAGVTVSGANGTVPAVTDSQLEAGVRRA